MGSFPWPADPERGSTFTVRIPGGPGAAPEPKTSTESKPASATDTSDRQGPRCSSLTTKPPRGFDPADADARRIHGRDGGLRDGRHETRGQNQTQCHHAGCYDAGDGRLGGAVTPEGGPGDRRHPGDHDDRGGQIGTWVSPSGAADYLIKPIDWNRLTVVLAKHCKHEGIRRFLLSRTTLRHGTSCGARPKARVDGHGGGERTRRSRTGGRPGSGRDPSGPDDARDGRLLLSRSPPDAVRRGPHHSGNCCHGKRPDSEDGARLHGQAIRCFKGGYPPPSWRRSRAIQMAANVGNDIWMPNVLRRSPLTAKRQPGPYCGKVLTSGRFCPLDGPCGVRGDSCR